MRRIVTLPVAFGFLVMLALPAAAQDVAPVPAGVVPVTEILSNREIYGVEGAVIRVAVEGELIGDYGKRSSGDVWTQLNDDPYARTPLVDGGELAGSNIGIGVRIPAELMEGIDPPGGYRLKGPLVRLTGDWRYHDPGRSGESYLDVVSLEVVEPGRVIQDDPHLGVLFVGLVVLAAAGLVALRVRADRKGS